MRRPWFRPNPLRIGQFGLAAGLLLHAAAQLSDDQAAALQAIARREPAIRWTPLSLEQLANLHRHAEVYLADYRRFHQPHGLTADILFSGPDRQRIEKYEGIGDAATWTGHYLATLAFAYAATRDPQRLTDMERVLATLRVLTRVSGKVGFIARFAGPADDSAYARYYSVYGAGPDPARPGLGAWAFRGAGAHSNLVWLSYTSRDVYLAVNLGLATAYRLAPDQRIRTGIRDLVETILDRLEADEWIIADPQGRKSRWQATPSFAPVWLRTGATVNPAKYASRYEASARPILEGPAPRLCGYCDYFPNNLEFATFYALTTLETDAARRAVYARKLEEMWSQVSDHLNAWFAAAYMSGTGDTSNLIARATVLGALADYPPPPRWDRATNHRGRSGLEFVSAEGRQWSRYALPIHERVPTDFLWQRSPFQLQGGSNAPLAYPGLDFLLPYWAARAAGVLPAPAGK